MLTRLVLIGNYTKTKSSPTFHFNFISTIKCLTWSHNAFVKIKKKLYDIILRFTLFLMIKWQLINAAIIYDTAGTTSRLFLKSFNCWYNPRMNHSPCLLTLQSSEKWRSPLFGATGNFNHQIPLYGILFLTFIDTNVFYLLSFKFSCKLVKIIAFSFKLIEISNGLSIKVNLNQSLWSIALLKWARLHVLFPQTETEWVYLEKIYDIRYVLFWNKTKTKIYHTVENNSKIYHTVENISKIYQTVVIIPKYTTLSGITP